MVKTRVACLPWHAYELFVVSTGGTEGRAPLPSLSKERAVEHDHHSTIKHAVRVWSNDALGPLVPARNNYSPRAQKSIEGWK